MTGSSDSVPTRDQVPHEIKTVPFHVHMESQVPAAVSCPAPLESRQMDLLSTLSDVVIIALHLTIFRWCCSEGSNTSFLRSLVKYPVIHFCTCNRVFI